MKTYVLLALESLVVLLAGSALLLVDVAFSVSLLQWRAFMALTLCAALMAALPRAPTRVRVVKVGVIVAAAVVISLIDWTVEKKFLRILQTIEIGMTEAQARAILVGFPEGTGWPRNPFDERPESTGSNGELRVPDHLIFRPTSQPGDSNWGLVKLGEDGRVVSVSFSPD
jgi:hypothetical protein